MSGTSQQRDREGAGEIERWRDREGDPKHQGNSERQRERQRRRDCMTPNSCSKIHPLSHLCSGSDTDIPAHRDGWGPCWPPDLGWTSVTSWTNRMWRERCLQLPRGHKTGVPPTLSLSPPACSSLSSPAPDLPLRSSNHAVRSPKCGCS